MSNINDIYFLQSLALLFVCISLVCQIIKLPKQKSDNILIKTKNKTTMNNVFYKKEGENEFVCYAYPDEAAWVALRTEAAAKQWVATEKQWQKLRDKISNLGDQFAFGGVQETEAIENKIEDTNQTAEEFATEIKNYILQLFPLVKECQLKSKLLMKIEEENEFN